MAFNADFTVSWTVSGGPGTNAATAEANLWTAHGSGYSDGTAIGDVGVFIPFATSLVYFQIESSGIILTNTTNNNGKAFQRHFLSSVNTTAPLSYSANPPLLGSPGYSPDGNDLSGSQSSAQLSYAMQMVCVNDVIKFYANGVDMSVSNQFGSTVPHLTLTAARTGPPGYVVVNGTPSNVQTWPVIISGFSATFAASSLFWTDDKLCVETP
jgi:hypothetical protein